MCWFGKIGQKQIAQEDTRVLKVLRVKDDKYYAYWFPFEYEFGKLYETELGVKCKDYVEIAEGFHCYSNLLGVVKKENRCTIQIMDYSGAKLDWYRGTFYKLVLVACTIPKGSEYYINDYGKIVSNKIIINQVVE